MIVVIKCFLIEGYGIRAFFEGLEGVFLDGQAIKIACPVWEIGA
jgi:hypothetical protein